MASNYFSCFLVLLLGFSSASLSNALRFSDGVVVVKRQAASAERPIGIGGSDPPQVNLNEPLAPIGGGAQEQIDIESNKNSADTVYDAVDEAAASTTTVKAPLPTNGGSGSAEAKGTTTTRSTLTTSGKGTEAEAEGTSGKPEEDEEKEAEREEEKKAGTAETSGNAEASSSTSPSSSSTTTTAEIRETTTSRSAGSPPSPSPPPPPSAKLPTAPKKEKDAVGKGKGGKGSAPQLAKSTVAGGGRTSAAATSTAATTVKAAGGDGGAQKLVAAQRNCNSEVMRKLILENIHPKPSIAKRQIQAKVAAEINGKIDVICAKHAFSYIVNSELFCEAESNGVICLCFKQQG